MSYYFYDLLQKKKKRNNILAAARFQPFCKAHNINLGFFDGNKIYPRVFTEQNKA